VKYREVPCMKEAKLQGRAVFVSRGLPSFVDACRGAANGLSAGTEDLRRRLEEFWHPEVRGMICCLS